MARILTEDEQELFNELKKMAVKANQRITRLEKETKLKYPFAVKQLYDYIDTFAITKSGRVKISKKLSVKQMKIEMKALKDFIKSDMSKVTGVKKFKKNLEKEIGVKLTYKETQVLYTAEKHYSWIYEYIPQSEFWRDYVAVAVYGNWSRSRWIEIIYEVINKQDGRSLDAELKNDLTALYIYCVQGSKGSK